MPQLQLPLFPAGVIEINDRIAAQKEAVTVLLTSTVPAGAQHAEQDVRGFRMFTSASTEYSPLRRYRGLS